MLDGRACGQSVALLLPLLARWFGNSPLLESTAELGFTVVPGSVHRAGLGEKRHSYVGLKSSLRIFLMTCFKGHSSSL